jgi:hypothetical protein
MPASVQVATVVAEPSLLEAFLHHQGQSREEANDLAERFFDASTALLRAHKALVQIQERAPAGKLSPDALDVYNRLVTSWYAEFDAALGKELEAIRQTGVHLSTDEVVRSGSIDVNTEIETNQILLKELIGHDAPETRTAPVVLTDLSYSVESLRKADNEEYRVVFHATSPALPSARNIQP